MTDSRITTPAPENKRGSQDIHARVGAHQKMCEARQAFARAWSDWARDANAMDVADEFSGSIKQLTDLTRLITGLDPHGKL